MATPPHLSASLLLTASSSLLFSLSSSLLLTLSSSPILTAALPYSSHLDYQEAPGEPGSDLLVPDYSTQQIEDMVGMLEDQRQPLDSPSWPEDYQDYLDTIALMAAQPRLSGFHKKDSEYLQYQPDPALTNHHLSEHPSIALRKTPSPSATPLPPTPRTEVLSAERRGMKEIPIPRPEARGPMTRGRKKRSTGSVRRLDPVPFLPKV